MPVLGALLLGTTLTAVAMLVALTAVGGRRRGHRYPVALVEGVLFPVAWAVWYARDRRD
ncbi:hypothetical protein P5P86_12240 [Nocardioides sp. BP30]|uniref:hypothetical protein n=1 Tax=Nocardioides sp. BP30 TaxID=3036374 RepID=UPI00246904CB|nr:hypothetical protein [Nocardioides sp. BP30]WGL50733.1 hypothetical protein P5P86_12240 [Nocardioides sp. BP30]